MLPISFRNDVTGGDVSPLLLIYGFPLSLLGFALKYAELEPVTCRTTQAALDLRPTQMTDIQQQVREDTTRYRYPKKSETLMNGVDSVKVW